MNQKSYEGKLQGYLQEFKKYKMYTTYLRKTNKQHSLKVMKYFFNKYIFISVIDFKNKEFSKLFINHKQFKKYMKNNPGKMMSRKVVKQEKTYRIFLREIDSKRLRNSS